MAVLTYNGVSYTVDHAAKGADYIHGYDAAGNPVVCFDKCADFSGFTYTGEYLDPSQCGSEACNGVIYVGGKLKTIGGQDVQLFSKGTEDLVDGESYLAAGQLYFVI